MAAINPLQQFAMAIPRDQVDQLKESIAEIQLQETPASTLPPSINSYTEVPERVQHYGPIKVNALEHPGIRRGIIVLDDVKAGEVLFKIDRPLFTSIENDKDALANTCDFCFASVHQESGIATVPSEKLRFYACGKCKLLRYCGKECQKRAWFSYHKFECRTLKKMQSWETSGGNELVRTALIRMLVRILELQVNDQIPEAQWAEIQSLTANKALTKGVTKFVPDAKMLCDILMKIIPTELSEAEVLDLVFVLKKTETAISPFLLRPDGSTYSNDTPDRIDVGITMDPFFALINHSCAPNASYTFDGLSLRVIASKPISAGEEVHLAYIDELGNYHKRREILQDRWSLDCVCSLCSQGPQGICAPAAGDLGKRVLQLIENGFPATMEGYVEISRAKDALEAAGYMLDMYPMSWFYRCIWASQTWQRDWDSAVKTCLKRLYQIEPPTSPTEERLDILYHLINQLQARGAVAGLSKAEFSAVLAHFRHVRSLEMQQILGPDSKTAAFYAAQKPEEDQLGVYIARLLDWAGIAEKKTKKRRIRSC